MLSRKGTKFFRPPLPLVCTIYPFVFFSFWTTMGSMQISGAEQWPEGARQLNRYKQRAGGEFLSRLGSILLSRLWVTEMLCVVRVINTMRMDCSGNPHVADVEKWGKRTEIWTRCSWIRASWYNYGNNQQDALYRLIYYSKPALHVSGDVFAHLREHLTVFTVSGSVYPSCCQPVFLF